MGLMTKLKSMFLLLRDRKNGRFAAAGCPVPHLEQEETLYGKLIMEQPISALLEVHTPAWLLENLSSFEFSMD
ncbi:hypothetical protein [Pseudomonas amygdali]|uniref:hypothetical protein n=1 Tax=Pseudomonas amygdali TaxID=47877 RepID=UPI000760AFE9|nr:hypothetical protein [Pseudomonas amygdali]AVB16001.1 hypothetical protein BKM19_022380 [Pseudomonas amygdali pv. morsprunorum]KWS61118.1 hypothetical protein AL056_20645 [Pseudomonas amygdali pv. morsprunorum]KWS63309.1 hypothetical protein AL054_04065 [Pseudomonas amygdali pv. morsprunorum]POC87442.1 hypothetical protein BKM08_13790 [Pseudomonas amygdali pv. morsprunorum]POP94504.1 hypothetical protein CXB39_10825 [Pseudomonas amygdali pv. morsprunorum]